MALIGFVPLSAQANKVDTDQNLTTKTILVMGDSLSAAHNIDIKAGWVSLLSERLEKGYDNIPGKKWQVVNASISGETTQGGRARISALLKKHQPDLCIIELGANDGLRGQSIKKMKNNLSKMIQQCQQYGKVLLLGIWLPPNYGKQYTQAFRAVYPALSEQYQVPLIPFFLNGVATELEYMQEDGLHPNEKGQPTILKNVWPTLQSVL